MISLLHIIEMILIIISFIAFIQLVGSILPPKNRAGLPSRRTYLLGIGIIIFTFIFMFGINHYISYYNSNHQKIGLSSLPASLKVNANGYWLVQSKITTNEINVVVRRAPFPDARGSIFETELLKDSKKICDLSFRICPALEKLSITWKSRIGNRTVMILVFDRETYEKINWAKNDFLSLPAAADYFWEDPNIDSPII